MNRVLQDASAISEMAMLSDVAYDSGEKLTDRLPDKWEVLTDDIGINKNDLFGFFDERGYYNYLNAQAFVARAGNTLAIVFRGTESGSPVDWTDDLYFGTTSHYTKFSHGFVPSVDKYIQQQSDSIQHIYVAGHSLGGAMVEAYLQDHNIGGFAEKILALTIGSPGFPYVAEFEDPRVLHLRHTGDPVESKAIEVLGGHSNGVILKIDLPRVNDGLIEQWSVAPEHRSPLYKDSATFLAQADIGAELPLSGSVNVVMLHNSRPFGALDDAVYAHSQPTNVVVVGQYGANQIVGNIGDDIIHGLSGRDTLSGGGGDDLIYGGLDDDDLRGMDGADTLFGGGFADTLFGGTGNDEIHGDGPAIFGSLSPYSDVLSGDEGNDTLYGGIDDDTYVFHAGDGNDVIDEEMRGGTDIIKLRGDGLIASGNIGTAIVNERDLKLSFQRTSGDDLGSITIERQGDEASRVELLQLFNAAGNVVESLDLRVVWDELGRETEPLVPPPSGGVDDETGEPPVGNTPPVVAITAPEQILGRGGVADANACWTASDAEGDAINWWAVYDDTPNASSAFFSIDSEVWSYERNAYIDGRVIPARERIAITAEQFSDLTVRAGSAALTDSLYAIASDFAIAQDYASDDGLWGEWKEIMLTTDLSDAAGPIPPVRANTSGSGAFANQSAEDPVISRDGRYVAFTSHASDLVVQTVRSELVSKYNFPDTKEKTRKILKFGSGWRNLWSILL